ncbi:MAG: zinc-binding dehydrogenase [Lachnospiraceae bacterium]|nr:zinc-binding dehydrogenase [Lachnospiraceae bacterium]
MKGWEFNGTHIPLKVVEKPDPQVKPGYVVLKTLAGGLCHSDVSALEHESWMPSFNVPVIMGHEVCGEIVEIGEGVEGYAIGDVVAVCPLHAKDGTTPGYTRDGGYGTMTTAPVEQLVKVPAGVSYAQAAAATDAGATAYHAVVTVGEIKAGMKVGGLGQIGCRVAVVKGCEVYVATRKKEAQELALSLGAKEVASSITEYADKNLDVIIDFAGGGKTTEDAILTVKPHGRVVIVGMAADYANINTMSMIMKEITFVGSQGSFPSELLGVMEMMADGSLDPVLNTISFDQIGEGIDLLTEGKVKGRLVCVY